MVCVHRIGLLLVTEKFTVFSCPKYIIGDFFPKESKSILGKIFTQTFGSINCAEECAVCKLVMMEFAPNAEMFIWNVRCTITIIINNIIVIIIIIITYCDIGFW